jgi:hypothetical protein
MPTFRMGVIVYWYASTWLQLMKVSNKKNKDITIKLIMLFFYLA